MRALAFRLRPRIKVPKLGIAPQVAIVLLVVGLAGAMAIEPTRQLVEQRRRIAGMTGELRKLQDSNQALEHRIERLNDPDFIEQEARGQIGLVRPGETRIVVMPPSDQAKHQGRKRGRAAKPQAPPPAPPTFVERLADFVGL